MNKLDTLTTAGTALAVGSAVIPAQDLSMQIIQIIGAIVTVAFQIVNLVRNNKNK